MTTTSRPSRLAARFVAAVALFAAGPASAWNAPGHRTVTRIAIATLPEDAPEWLRSETAIEAATYQCYEPDRWRGTPLPALKQRNDPDHYLDVELLAAHGMSLATLPPLRYPFVAQLVRTPPESTERRGVIAFNSATVGFLPYAISEHYALLVSSFNTVRILETLDADVVAPEARDRMLATARQNAWREMGQLSHFVGDAGQPLHTTIHHHGWTGENPHGYTTEPGFHAYVDGAIVSHHHLDGSTLRPWCKPLPMYDPEDAWTPAIELIGRSFSGVEPLYRLQQSGALEGDEGRDFIADRLTDAAAVLAGMYWAAWQASAPTPQQRADFIRYNEFDPPPAPPVDPAPIDPAMGAPAAATTSGTTP
ncbi:MAG: hypothetical protein KDA22_16315 [Phycisphaerales bacterium]|nr:hypothetical protein [Phycisphaerales bacterium]